MTPLIEIVTPLLRSHSGASLVETDLSVARATPGEVPA